MNCARTRGRNKTKKSGQAIFEYCVVGTVFLVATMAFWRAFVQNSNAQFSEAIQDAMTAMTGQGAPVDPNPDPGCADVVCDIANCSPECCISVPDQNGDTVACYPIG